MTDAILDAIFANGAELLIALVVARGWIGKEKLKKLFKEETTAGDGILGIFRSSHIWLGVVTLLTALALEMVIFASATAVNGAIRAASWLAAVVFIVLAIWIGQMDLKTFDERRALSRTRAKGKKISMPCFALVLEYMPVAAAVCKIIIQSCNNSA